MAKAPVNKTRRRILIVAIMLSCVASLVLIGRLFQLQVIQGEYYQKLAVKQQVRSTTISPERGSIYDRNGKTLAQSATVWTVFISPADIKTDEQKNLICDGLSEILEVDRDKIAKKCENKNNYYDVVKKKIEKDTADKVLAFVNENDLNGVHLEVDNKRYYPYGTLASTVIGFTGNDNQGALGIEAYYNKVLNGTPGRVVAAKNAWGTDMPFRYQKMYEASDGNSLVLTIDEVVQHYLEKHLSTAVIEHDVANRAVGIVMDVKTGEILGMSTKPDFDPNQPLVITDPKAIARLEEIEKTTGEQGKEYEKQLAQEQFNQWRNKAISDPYEPGSVFKLVTASAALETGSVQLQSHFNCTGSISVAGRNIGCWKRGGHGNQNFIDAVKNSCNPAFILTGQALGGDEFYNYFDNFGLTELTGIDLPGEAESIYYGKSALGISQLSSASFGQTFKVTPIQLITAVSASVNGGKLMKPYIVKQVLDASGNVIESTEPTVRRQVISEEVSATIRMLGEEVVKDGSGRKAAIPGFRIGGKTGTSEKLDTYVDGVRTDKNVLSFFGFAPADDPQIAVLVLLDEPAGQAYGSTIAAPVVGAILNDILEYLGVEPKYTEEQLQQSDVKVGYYIGQKPHDAQGDITQLGLKTRIIGNGPTVLKQIPLASQSIPKGGVVILYTEETEEQTTITVPSVIGLAGNEVNKTIENMGLNIRIVGDVEGVNMVAVSQSPAAGEVVEFGTVVEVTFGKKEDVSSAASTEKPVQTPVIGSSQEESSAPDEETSAQE